VGVFVGSAGVGIGCVFDAGGVYPVSGASWGSVFSVVLIPLGGVKSVNLRGKVC
jgi:hypothetical protein